VNANTHSKNMGYTKAVDWWSFGITMYRILLGKYPFPLNENKTTSLSAVLSGCVDFSALEEYPTTIDLISRLLVVSESNRLGYGDSGSLDVAKHGYFSCIDWLKLNAGELTPPPLPDNFFMKTVDVDRTLHYHNLTEVLATNNRYCWTQFGTPASTTFDNDEKMQQYFKAWNYASNEAITAEIQMW
jgi:serine/threonine protein kinase